jgi:hypothetical protein
MLTPLGRLNCRFNRRQRMGADWWNSSLAPETLTLPDRAVSVSIPNPERTSRAAPAARVRPISTCSVPM